MNMRKTSEMRIVVEVVPLSGSCEARGVGVAVTATVTTVVAVGLSAFVGVMVGVFVTAGFVGATVVEAGVAVGWVPDGVLSGVGLDCEPPCSQSNEEEHTFAPGPGTSTHRPNRHSR